MAPPHSLPGTSMSIHNDKRQEPTITAGSKRGRSGSDISRTSSSSTGHNRASNAPQTMHLNTVNAPNSKAAPKANPDAPQEEMTTPDTPSTTTPPNTTAVQPNHKRRTTARKQIRHGNVGTRSQRSRNGRRQQF